MKTLGTSLPRCFYSRIIFADFYLSDGAIDLSRLTANTFQLRCNQCTREVTSDIVLAITNRTLWCKKENYCLDIYNILTDLQERVKVSHMCIFHDPLESLWKFSYQGCNYNGEKKVMKYFCNNYITRTSKRAINVDFKCHIFLPTPFKTCSQLDILYT